MTTLSNQWPIFAAINTSFDRTRLYNEILSSGILSKGELATSHLVNGKNYHDNGVNFKDDKFLKHSGIPLYTDESRIYLTDSNINTFHQVNVTTNTDDNNNTASAIGNYKDNSKLPVWIKYNHPWKYRTDVNLPYLVQIINSFKLNYVSTVRIIYQHPPSIGFVHRDSGIKTNTNYYNNFGVSITLNVSDGGANLYVVDNKGIEHMLNTSNILAWHFNDAFLHCTDEVTSTRIQVRIYGSHPNYQSMFTSSNIITEY